MTDFLNVAFFVDVEEVVSLPECAALSSSSLEKSDVDIVAVNPSLNDSDGLHPIALSSVTMDIDVEENNSTGSEVKGEASTESTSQVLLSTELQPSLLSVPNSTTSSTYSEEPSISSVDSVHSVHDIHISPRGEDSISEVPASHSDAPLPSTTDRSEEKNSSDSPAPVLSEDEDDAMVSNPPVVEGLVDPDHISDQQNDDSHVKIEKPEIL